MRSTFSLAGVRDAARICARCRLQQQQQQQQAAIRRASTLTRPRLHPLSAAAERPSPWPLWQSPSSSSRSKHTTTTTSPHTPPSQKTKTLYDLFPESLPAGAPPSGPFHIDTRSLRREFLRLQAAAHPDLHPPSNKPLAEATSAHINHAYKTLAFPLPRAQYLLSLRDIDVANDERLQVKDPALLELAMLAHEEISEAQNEEDISGAKSRNEERIRDCEANLEAAFARDDLQNAAEEAVRLRYLVNIQTALDNWEPGKPVVLIH